MIKPVKKEDAATAAALMLQLWPDHTLSELESDVAETAENGENQYFLTYDGSTPVGFAHCSLRHDYVEGTGSSPVGYLEGIFLMKGHRGKGYARELLTACERWAKAQGCQEFASDCALDNTDSLRFHRALGFAEANRVICFTKAL